MALQGTRRRKPSPEQIGKRMREGFGAIGKLLKKEDVVLKAAKMSPKKPAVEKPPKPAITSGLRRHRASIKARELRPSVAGLLRAQ
ncbi:hypothetical protein LCGC14_1740700 [marine sediment metagenome]|uniref:Uncharacterized protein n=1 Tax=marine sediment metagenome TaxID=412755 RepID=A0A0F9K6I8_9ZZZZ